MVASDETIAFDFDAYMEMIVMVVDEGQLDYSKVMGDTGPMCYPAGFVPVYGAIRQLVGWDIFTMTTEVNQKNFTVSGRPEFWPISDRTHWVSRDRPVEKLQLVKLIFAVFYVAIVATVAVCYIYSDAVPWYGFILLVGTQRARNVAVFGFFNDVPAVLFAHLAIFLFVKNRWGWGCLFYSYAVACKMNIILYAPGLLVLLIQSQGVRGAVKHIALCAAVQVGVAFPYLATYPVQYVTVAFNIGRKFVYEQTVNMRWLSYDTFMSRELGLALLVCHLSVLLLFASRIWCKNDGGTLRMVRLRLPANAQPVSLSAEHILTVMYSAQLIGIAFARTMHYQFLVWYFHTLPYLLWRANVPTWSRFALIVILEVAYNVVPPTEISSMIVLACNVTVVGVVLLLPVAGSTVKEQAKRF